jgi:hypothetical protein
LLDCRKGALGRAAEDEIAIVMVPQMADNMIAWISTVKEQDRSRPDIWQQTQGLFSFRSVNTDYRSCQGNASKYIISGCDQTLWVVSFAFVIETTFGIELLSILLCCRQFVLGAVKSNDRHTMPKIGGIPWPELVGQPHGIIQNISEDGP